MLQFRSSLLLHPRAARFELLRQRANPVFTPTDFRCDADARIDTLIGREPVRAELAVAVRKSGHAVVYERRLLREAVRGERDSVMECVAEAVRRAAKGGRCPFERCAEG